MRKVFPLCLLLLVNAACAQVESPPVSVLIVTAHPDDEVMFAATTYRITHALGGTVDLALMTDGAGGYHYSTLSESIYGRKITDPEVAKNYLPAIRKQELMAAGTIDGIRNYFFIDQPDLGKTQDQDSILAFVWDREYAAIRLDKILARGHYDFIFTHLPLRSTHSHHKAATILALQAVGRLPSDERPVILAGQIGRGPDDLSTSFSQLEGYPETRIYNNGPFLFDRSTPLGYNDRLNYNIIANWMIAEYKSQGTMQLYMSESGVERFWVYEMNGRGAVPKTSILMEQVRSAPF